MVEFQIHSMWISQALWTASGSRKIAYLEYCTLLKVVPPRKDTVSRSPSCFSHLEKQSSVCLAFISIQRATDSTLCESWKILVHCSPSRIIASNSTCGMVLTTHYLWNIPLGIHWCSSKYWALQTLPLITSHSPGFLRHPDYPKEDLAFFLSFFY